MEEPPPPPPPHGENPRTQKSGGLPDGKYDIFVVPPNSAGAGFIYLPSLNTQRNSFLAGCACTAAAFFIYSVAVPVIKEWLFSTVNGGGSGVLMLVCAVGVVSWALGKTQGEGGTGASSKGPSPSQGYADPPPRSQSQSQSRRPPPPPPPPEPESEPEPEPTPPPPKEQPKPAEPPPKPAEPPPPEPEPAKPKSTWERPKPGTDGKSAWEKAREETRKKEEERKRADELRRRREELERERQKHREKETLERLEREWREKKAAEEKAAKDSAAAENLKKQKEELEKRLKREREKREREAREAKVKAEAEERAKKERELTEAAENARLAALEEQRKADEARIASARAAAAETERRDAERRAASAAASAKASSIPKRPPMPSARTEMDDDAYSFRPYDRPRTTAQKSSSGSVYSDDSYAPSATTARTTPPASTRGPYTTKDPDKIIIKGVYSFNNAFMRTPVSQLLSGQGIVTDGLILRITTEGLFIDDDVRGVPQREWDVKAWTMKAAEHTDIGTHHVLRASIRDQEGKKYVFIIAQSEGWKVAVGLQKLRKGSQVRALNVAGLPGNEAKMLLETLGYV